MNFTDIFYNYAVSVVPIGWAYYIEESKITVPKEMLLEARHEGQLVNIFPCATAFIITIDEDRTLLVTANHAFPNMEVNQADICVIVPQYKKCPYEVSPDDLNPYIGVTNFVRLEEQDTCVFEVDTPETLYLQHPIPLPLSLDFKVGDEVCTIGYPFIGYEGRFTNGRRDMRFVERLTCAHLSAVWPDRDAFTLEFDNYIGPGNSGGPLISARTGAVIGVVTWSRVETQYHSVTTFSHATCIIEIERARERFPDLPKMLNSQM